MEPGPGEVALDTIVEHAPVGLGFWDTGLRLRRANAALRRMAGAQACLGTVPSQLLGPLGVELERLIAGVIATEEPVVPTAITAPIAGRSEGPREWVGAYFPVFGRGGALLGVAGLIRESADERGSSADLQRALQVAIVARTEAETARARTGFIAQAGARMATSLDADQALRRLAGAAVPELGDWCAISTIGRDGDLQTVAVAHVDPQRVAAMWAIAGQRVLHVDDGSVLARALRERRALCGEAATDADLSAITGGDEARLAQLREIGVGSWLVVPLLGAERPIGTIAFVFADSGRRHGTEDVAMAEALAAWAALHVENARLYAERSRIASTLQEGLQAAPLPDVPGVEVAVRYRPAGLDNTVGGDFYDVFETRDGWQAVVGDVSGKGADAASTTALARHTIFAGALQGGDGVANLRLLNQALLRRSGPEGFCTVVAIDITVRRAGRVALRIANGGHPAPLVLRADGTIEETVASGTLIGAVGEILLEAQEVVLAPGDALVVFTDGAVELRGDDPTAGARGLREALGRSVGLPASGLAGVLERTVVAAAGGEPRDDVALLVLRAPG